MQPNVGQEWGGPDETGTAAMSDRPAMAHAATAAGPTDWHSNRYQSRLDKKRTLVHLNRRTGALGHGLCLFRSKQTDADRMGRRVGIAIRRGIGRQSGFSYQFT